jgi:3-oxoacyl-(acyl-carrier-protein) synthase
MSTASSIVVTGLGVISSVGAGLESFWSALYDGFVGTNELTRFDTSSLSCHRGGEAVNPPSASMSNMRRSLAVRMAMTVASEAVNDASLTASNVSAERFGVVFGSVMSTRPSLETWIKREANVTETTIETGEEWQWTSPSLLARAPAQALGIQGPNCVLSSACASGNSAIAYASELLRTGHADAMVAGGADEISHAMLMMFDSFRALAHDCVKPFDRDRSGLMLADGAAALVLEREPDARARGARIYGRILGYANSCDAHHITAPHPDGRGAVRSMLATLLRAGAQSHDVDCISAHGTGTPSNDAIEARAIRTVFGGHADHLPVFSLKGAAGHAQGAAGTIEAVCCLLALQKQLIPATANFTTPDPECDIDVVAGKPREHSLRIILSNAFGFGGNIECVAFGAT